MHFIVSIIINALALYVVTLVVKGVHYDSVWPALIVAAIVLGIVNAIVRPVLMLLSLPFIILTLGLFALVVNGVALWLVGVLVPGFHVDNLWSGILGAIVLAVISWIVGAVGLNKVGTARST
ncbi:MAG TPA: phage holin family protein [Candidatus Baltobacteraceae bacterium]|nr:phage holin family protein [Candidatus Baltobacteraceae bacterium]